MLTTGIVHNPHPQLSMAASIALLLSLCQGAAATCRQHLEETGLAHSLPALLRKDKGDPAGTGVGVSGGAASIGRGRIGGAHCSGG
jgi:hypothetical protein